MNNLKELKDKYFNLSNDVMFKLFYHNKRNLKNFLNLINKELKLFDFEVSEDNIEYQSSIDFDTDLKNVDLDVKFSIINHKTIIDFEMQKDRTEYNLGDRMARYQATLLRESLEKGDDYGSSVAISIWILDYDDARIMDIENPNWYDIYRYVGETSNIEIAKGINKIIGIFLNHIDKSSIIELEEYFKLFKLNSKNTLLNTNVAKEGYLMLNDLNNDENLRWKAFRQEDENRSNRVNLDLAHKRGLAEGIAEGKKEGLAEGKKEGLAEGILLTAKNLIKLGVANEIIASSTNLSIEEIEKIRKEM